MKGLRIYLFAFLACVALDEATAQQDTATVQPSFNALNYSLQKRYHPGDKVQFERKKGTLNLFVSAFAGFDKLLSREETDFAVGSFFGASVGKNVSRVSTFRGSLFGGSYTRNFNHARLTRWGAELDYIFNVSTFIAGYNPGRMFEVSTVSGLGYQLAFLEKQSAHVGEFHLGLQFRLHTSPSFDFYLEPRAMIQTDGMSRMIQHNWHKYDLSFGATAGLTYRFQAAPLTSRMKMLDGDGLADNTFVSFASGMQMQLSKMTSDIGTLKSAGPAFSLSLGKWLTPAFGIRLSGFSSADTWHEQKKGSYLLKDDGAKGPFYEMATYTGGRLEGMFKLLYFFNGRQTDAPFDINLLAGGEFGHMRKENDDTPVKCGYTGFTGGAQFKFQLTDYLAFFVEPHTSLISYSLNQTSESGKNYREKYSDYLFNLNIGLEIRRSSAVHIAERSLNRELFQPSYFVSVGAGGCLPLQLRRYTMQRKIDYIASASVGRHLTPLSSFRVAGDYSRFSVSTLSGDVDYGLVSVGADYLFNLSNCMAGYVPERKFDCYLLAGLVGAVRTKPEVVSEDLSGEWGKSRFVVGGDLGLLCSYRLNQSFGVYLEPKVRFYGSKLLPHENLSGSDAMMSVQVGAFYHF